jgi:selenocysteine-specific elongation factor
MAPSFSIILSHEDQEMQVRVLNTLNEEGFTSSSIDQLTIKTGYQKDTLIRILSVAEKEGKLLRIDGNLMFTQKNFIDLKNKVVQHFTSSEILSVPQFKELAKTSRKYAVPLLEYFDKQKITFRDGDSRKLVK